MDGCEAGSKTFPRLFYIILCVCCVLRFAFYIFSPKITGNARYQNYPNG